MDETVEEKDLNDLLKIFGCEKSAVSIYVYYFNSLASKKGWIFICINLKQLKEF